MKLESKKLLALIRATHPIPCLAVASFSALFGIGAGVPFDRSMVIFLVVLLQQISVGLSNDWLDYKRDLIAKRSDKPTVNGEVKVAELRVGSLVAASLAQLSALFFGGAAGIVMFGMLLAGWAYNLGMKTNWSSAIPYAIGFGAIPIFVGQAAVEPFWAQPWIVLVAALLGISAHFANVLPDAEADRLTGVKSLPHILGQRVSALVIAFSALSATLIVVTQSQNLNSIAGAVGLGANIVIIGLASALSLMKRPHRASFSLLILASLVNVVLLMLGLSS